MLTLLIGLPGSVKSTYLHTNHAKVLELIVYEDFLGAHKPLDGGKGLFSLLCDVQAGKNVVADDTFLCRLDYRTTFETLMRPFVLDSYPVRWVYYANSPEECRSNVELQYRQTQIGNDKDRGHAEERRKHSLHWIENLSPRYHIPDDAEQSPVIRHPG